MKNDVPAAEGDEAARAVIADRRLFRFCVIGIFLFALIYALYFARDFFMPVVLAFLLALMLTPLVRVLGKHGVPPPLSATFLVFLSVIFFGAIGYFLSGPAIQLANDAPSIGRRVGERLAQIQHPFQKIVDISTQIEKITGAAEEPGVQKVVVAQPGIISQAAGNLISGSTSAAIVFVLSIFLLASGTMFYEKIVQSFTRMSEKKRALRVVYDVEREISRYLLTVAIINAALGLAIGSGLWLLGVPNAPVWGVLAALLNFLPYIGAAATILMVAAISLISFESLSFALIPPAYVICCNVIEGQLVTPLVVGRRLEINAVAIFIAVAFWSWLWGFIGALIAVPLLVIIKVFCDHFDGLSHIGNFLSAQQSYLNDEDEPAATAPVVTP
jgi:predicted PurR-regulated permease PerM